MTNVDLARWQFAFTSVNHFLFVPVTIGLAFLTALLQTAWHRSKRDEYLRLTRFFGTLLVISLYPNVMVSSTNAAYNLTVRNTASGAYSLKLMTVVVIVFLPFVVAYQTWTYYVFRRRISQQEFRPPPQPGTLAGVGPPVSQEGRRSARKTDWKAGRAWVSP